MRARRSLASNERWGKEEEGEKRGIQGVEREKMPNAIVITGETFREKARPFVSFLFFFSLFFANARTATKISPVIAKIRGASAGIKIGVIKLLVIFPPPIFFSFFPFFFLFRVSLTRIRYLSGNDKVQIPRICTISTGNGGTVRTTTKLGEGKEEDEEKRFPRRERESVSIDLPPGYRFPGLVTTLQRRNGV